MMIQVQKRDGTQVPFDINKIKACLQKAGVQNDENISCVLGGVASAMMLNSHVTVEEIQDIVEQQLMENGLYDIAKSYIIYRQEREKQRKETSFARKLASQDIQVPWGPLGYVTYKRTYARKTHGKTEEFKDTILRVLEACQHDLGVGFTNQEMAQVYAYMMGLKFSVAGRFLWQLGTSTVKNLGLSSLQNCAFVKIDEPVKPFMWIFDMLMLGSGVGISVERRNIEKLPHVLDKEIHVTRKDVKDADFIVPDSREGWVALLEKVLEAYFIKGKSFTYSTVLIRSAGSPISGFGGVASGPEDLCAGIGNICKIIQAKRGAQLSSVDCLDIVDIIGMIVVSGNVRRSAILAIGDYDDKEYLQAKRWDLGNIPNWRAMSNNSVACDDTSKLPQEFWDGYQGKGEPYGLINLPLSRKIGRIKDGEKYPDPAVEGYNPCAEQSLANYETCCLAEVFLPNITSFDEFKRVTTYAYRICKHSLMLDCHHEDTGDIVHKNMRMGIGITGYLQSTQEQKSWLDLGYEFLRGFDRAYAAQHNMPPSIKLTTCKPSGTLSLLAGVTPGVHPAIYKYYIRRIRIATNNPLVGLCQKYGYHVEYQKNFDGSSDVKTSVVSFPCKSSDIAILAKDTSAIQQLEHVKDLQTAWSDNSVSCTVYYKLEELDTIKEWLAKNYTHNVKTCSFLLHYDHNFAQAPYEEITQEVYENLIANTRPITHGDIDLDDLDNLECVGGACPIK